MLKVSPHHRQPSDDLAIDGLVKEPLILTRDSQRILDVIMPWLDGKDPFIIVGPGGPLIAI
jgi:hypothetical protein